jgi:hypothetical protein
MIYDEGFELTYDDLRFFTFSRYFHDSDFTYKSDCGNTLVGWWKDESAGKRGCYRAARKEAIDVTDNVKQDKVV